MISSHPSDRDWRTDDFDYALPPELIADRPPERRDGARMMVIDRAAGTIEHRRFTDFPDYLSRGDLVVLNDTKVVRARFFSDDGKIELLRLERTAPGVWRCLVKPGRKMRIGQSVRVGGASGAVTGILDDGSRLIAWDREPDEAAFGHLALPHYLGRPDDAADVARYQTVFAAEEKAGAIAAPTAGLHFTPELLATVPHAFVTLHVGVGTFQPVRAERIAEHTMHIERYDVSPATAEAVAAAPRVVSVGSTVTRVLEHVAAANGGRVVPGAGETGIFIAPGYRFQCVGALLTNFHLPKSTLLMLVSAFAGYDLVREAYAAAVAEKYRFFSYGDCMFIL